MERNPAASVSRQDPGDLAAVRRVLIVDDNRASAESLELIVSLWGHASLAVFDGPDALRSAGPFAPDTVLVDLSLPGLDGFEVARRLRADPRLRDALFIAMTGHDTSELSEKVREGGFAHLWRKPLDLDSLERFLAHAAA